MTVKSIPADTQFILSMDYQMGLSDIPQLMAETGKSRRTIIRMLKDYGVDVPQRHRRTRAEIRADYAREHPEVVTEPMFAGVSPAEVIFTSPVNLKTEMDLELPIPVSDFQPAFEPTRPMAYQSQLAQNFRLPGYGSDLEEVLVHEPMVARRPAFLDLIGRVKRFFSSAA